MTSATSALSFSTQIETIWEIGAPGGTDRFARVARLAMMNVQKTVVRTVHSDALVHRGSSIWTPASSESVSSNAKVAPPRSIDQFEYMMKPWKSIQYGVIAVVEDQMRRKKPDCVSQIQS